MSVTHCNEFLEFLEPWMDGERPPEAQAHFRACSQCQELVSDLEAIRTAGRRLAEEVEPPPRAWTALRARLQEEGLIHHRNWAENLSDWFGGLVPEMPRPAVVGAYLLAIVAATGLVLTTQRLFPSNDSRWVDHVQATILPLHNALSNAELHSASTTNADNPPVAASLHQNLAVVDKYIRLCEKSVREEPQNEVARDYLYDAYQQKVQLLNDMSERGVNGR